MKKKRCYIIVISTAFGYNTWCVSLIFDAHKRELRERQGQHLWPGEGRGAENQHKEYPTFIYFGVKENVILSLPRREYERKKESKRKREVVLRASKSTTTIKMFRLLPNNLTYGVRCYTVWDMCNREKDVRIKKHIYEYIIMLSTDLAQFFLLP